jgi:protein ImuB
MVMTVPSYDDLTPGIPNVLDTETASNLASLLRELPAAGSRLSAAGSRLSAAGSRLSATGSQLSAAGSRLSAAGSQLSAPGSQLSAAGSRLSAAGFQLSAAAVFACLRLGVDSGKLKADSGELEAESRQPNAESPQLEAVLAVARDFSPRVKQVSAHEVLLDVSGLGRLIGPPDEIARQLARALREAFVDANVAIAPTQTTARLLAHAETVHGLTLRHKDHKVHTGHEYANSCCDLCDLRGLCAGACSRGSWQPLPVQLLQELEVLPPAMNHRDRARPYETFQRWGIATLGELAALPAAALSSRLGRRGVALQRLARGLDPAPFVPDGETPRFMGRLELEWPIDGLEPLSFVFARLLDPLSAALERADRAAAAVRLDLRLTDRSTHARVLALPAPIRDPRVLRTLLLLDLESWPLFAAQRGGVGVPPSEVMIDVVAIELDPAPSRITQFSLLQRALPSPEALATLTARLSALVGDSRAGWPVLLDTHEPGAFAMERYAPEGAKGAEGAGGADGAGAGGAGGADGAGAGGAAGVVLRRERRTVALLVRLEHGRPRHIAASRRGVPCGAIVQAAGPWRTSGGWWTNESWSRNEWDVALKSGVVCRLFQDRTTDRWFLEGVYD